MVLPGIRTVLPYHSAYWWWVYASSTGTPPGPWVVAHAGTEYRPQWTKKPSFASRCHSGTPADGYVGASVPRSGPVRFSKLSMGSPNGGRQRRWAVHAADSVGYWTLTGRPVRADSSAASANTSATMPSATVGDTSPPALIASMNDVSSSR